MAIAPAQHLRTVSLLFGTLRARGGRTALCTLFSTLVRLPNFASGGTVASTAKRGGGGGVTKGEAAAAAAAPADLDGEIAADVPRLIEASEVLSMLNAYSAEELEEADYDLRLDGYNRLPKLLVGSSSRVAMPLLCHAIHDAELDDIALKHSASHSITLIAKHCASQPDGGPHRAIMERVLMPALRRGLRLPAEKDALRQDMLRLLGATLLILPSLQPELASLLSPHEPEADFFQTRHTSDAATSARLARLRQRSPRRSPLRPCPATCCRCCATSCSALTPRRWTWRRRCRLSPKSAGSRRGGPTSRRFRPLHACSRSSRVSRSACCGPWSYPRRLSL